jgi:hypothetical protein
LVHFKLVTFLKSLKVHSKDQSKKKQKQKKKTIPAHPKWKQSH